MRNLHTHKNTILLKAIKGWHSATTYITHKKILKTQKLTRMIVHLNKKKLREEKGLLQFAN